MHFTRVSNAHCDSQKKGGIDSTLTTIREPPAIHVWGEAKRNLSNDIGTVVVRGDMNAIKREEIDLSLRVNAFRDLATIRVLGSAGMYTL